MEKELKEMTKEERLELLKEVNPEAYRILSAIIQARQHQEEGIPEGFAYVRALQEFDKEKGVKLRKGHYVEILQQYEEITESYRE